MEIWKSIPHIPDFEASSFGRIRRVSHCKNLPPDGILKQRKINSGYMVVSISFRGHSYPQLVHRLITEAFMGLCPFGQEVNHKDKNKTNNHYDNLEYLSRSANLIHSGSYRGERNGQAKITELQVHYIRSLYAQGLGYKRIAKQTGFSWGIIRRVAKRQTWTWMP